MLNIPFDIVNDVLSVSPAPATKAYAGLWVFRILFRGIILPTTLVSVFTVVLFSLTYHGPKFWLNALARVNMLFMSVARDTFHEDMSWLKAAAL